MGFFRSKRQPSAIALVPTEMTEEWFDDLIRRTPTDAGLEANARNFAYARNFLMISVIDDAMVDAMVIDKDHAARSQYEELIGTTDSLEARMSFLNGWKPEYVPLLRDRILRQRQRFLIDLNEDYPIVTKEELRAQLADHRRTKPYG